MLERIMADETNGFGMLGAVSVVAGLMLAALGGRKPNIADETE